MGAIVPPFGGVVYFDANALIYSAETHPTYWPLLEPLWNLAQSGKLQLATSELSILECLVGPIATSDAVMRAAYEGIFASPEVTLHPISPGILRTAANLRAIQKGLRTPDSIHAATSLVYLPSLFVTNDAGFERFLGYWWSFSRSCSHPKAILLPSPRLPS